MPYKIVEMPKTFEELAALSYLNKRSLLKKYEAIALKAQIDASDVYEAYRSNKVFQDHVERTTKWMYRAESDVDKIREALKKPSGRGCR